MRRRKANEVRRYHNHFLVDGHFSSQLKIRKVYGYEIMSTSRHEFLTWAV